MGLCRNAAHCVSSISRKSARASRFQLQARLSATSANPASRSGMVVNEVNVGEDDGVSEEVTGAVMKIRRLRGPFAVVAMRLKKTEIKYVQVCRCGQAVRLQLTCDTRSLH